VDPYSCVIKLLIEESFLNLPLEASDRWNC